MSVASADLHKAINTAWEASGLNAAFNALWSDPAAVFPVLHDQEASPGQPFPYCVFEESAGSTINRMSGIDSDNREIRDVPWNFRIHARAIDGDGRTAKGIAAAMAEEVIEVFGGHPTVNPVELVLDNGNHLTTIFVTDYGVREGEDEYLKIVSYLFRLDVPVMV